ncbi:tripartite tricarboxylate transporter substrate binding protein [Bradyrhizobium sp. DN5]|uniref:Bug family tripartite tricarboxylate transporter substrate binding protein n=1 Tax=Bradyrhizobium sp. DN5 TaxID=3056950 RepID=UPI0035261A81
MPLQRRDLLKIAFATIATAAVPRIALVAESYPTRSVRLIVGFPVGGPVDIAGRVIAPWLSERLGQPFIVENQPGESGNVATRSVVKAEPDGHTLLVCGPVNTINTTLFKELDFDFGRDITPVADLYQVPLVIEVHPSVPIRTVSELVAYARANPGKLKVGFAGRGTPQHIGIELFKTMTGIDVTLVPYLGSRPALSDLLAGSIHAMFDPMPSSIAHIKRGELVPIAVTTLSRSANLPDVPIAADTVAGYEAGSWFGIGAPRATPKDIVDKLNGEVNAALATPSIKEKLAELGGNMMPGSQAQFEQFIVQETEKYAGVIRLAGLAAK